MIHGGSIRTGAVSALIGLVAAVLAGCTSAPSSTSPSGGGWTQIFQARAASATSDFERAAFERAVDSGSIAKADADESVTRFIGCMAEAGFEVALEEQGQTGVYQMSSSGYPESQAGSYEEANATCEASSGLQVFWTWQSVQRNPANQDWDTIMSACLVRLGVAPAGYDAAAYAADREEDYKEAPYTLDDPLVQACYANPTTAGTGGTE